MVGVAPQPFLFKRPAKDALKLDKGVHGIGALLLLGQFAHQNGMVGKRNI
jgi:hypothetical protein